MGKLGYPIQKAVVLLLLAMAASVLRSQATSTDTLEVRRNALNAVFHDYWEENLKNSPEFASTLGDKRYNDKISDFSVKAFNENLARERKLMMRLAAIDPAGFTVQEKLSRDLLLRDFAEDQEAAQFKEWEMPIDQMGGIYTFFPLIVPQLSFASTKDYEDWIARLHAMPTAFDQVIANMSLGMLDHRVPPKYLLQKALEQLKPMANQAAEDSPLALPVKKFPPSISAVEQARLNAETVDTIRKEVLPAYLKLERFLEQTYVPAGRSEPGISALPDGEKYYQFLIRRTTTTNLTAEQIHEIGVDEVKKDESEMLTIAQKLGFKDLKSFQASIKTNPKMKATSREALLNAYRSYLDPMQARLPELFGRLPKAKFEVAAVPDYVETTSSGAYYEGPAPDGSRPGRIRVNTYKATDRNLYDVESTAYHEGLPGHHLQTSIAQELVDVPTFRNFEFYTAFSEGWGLYAERLGKDIGLYQDPYSDYGRLENDMLRAIRLVVDTGIHSQHWTRDQVVQYFHDHSAIDETDVQSETDRYISWPSQALAYKVGQLKILQLRDKAKGALGDKFDIRSFHDQVLDSGALPLDLLDKQITAWIAPSVKGKD